MPWIRTRKLALACLGAASFLSVAWYFSGAGTASERVAATLRSEFAPPHVADTPSDTEDTEPPASAETGDEGASEIEPASATPPPDLPPAPERPRGLRGTSFVMLLGLDNRSDRLTGRADTIIIAAFRHRDGKMAAFSIPRDLWVELPELGPARINSTVRIGEYKLGSGEGIPLLRRVIEDNFGIHIDHHVRVDLAGFVAAVDALGGVELDLPCPIQDCFWLERDDPSCHMLALDAGRQHLDGQSALLYARSRHGRGDRDRTRRQQAVVLALARKARAAGLRGLPRLWRVVSPHVDTSLDLDAALYYASYVLDGEGLETVGGFAITHPLVRRHVTEDDKHVLLLEREAFDAALAGLFESRLPAQRETRTCPAADVALRGRPSPP